MGQPDLHASRRACSGGGCAQGHANLQVFNGAVLAEAFPALEGTGKGVRHLKVRYAQAVDAPLVTTLVRARVAQLASVGG